MSLAQNKGSASGIGYEEGGVKRQKKPQKTKKQEGNFTGSLVVKIPCSQCKGDLFASLLWELDPTHHNGDSTCRN